MYWKLRCHIKTLRNGCIKVEQYSKLLASPWMKTKDCCTVDADDFFIPQQWPPGGPPYLFMWSFN